MSPIPAENIHNNLLSQNHDKIENNFQKMKNEKKKLGP